MKDVYLVSVDPPEGVLAAKTRRARVQVYLKKVKPVLEAEHRSGRLYYVVQRTDANFSMMSYICMMFGQPSFFYINNEQEVFEITKSRDHSAKAGTIRSSDRHLANFRVGDDFYLWEKTYEEQAS